MNSRDSLTLYAIRLAYITLLCKHAPFGLYAAPFMPLCMYYALCTMHTSSPLTVLTGAHVCTFLILIQYSSWRALRVCLPLPTPGSAYLMTVLRHLVLPRGQNSVAVHLYHAYAGQPKSTRYTRTRRAPSAEDLALNADSYKTYEGPINLTHQTEQGSVALQHHDTHETAALTAA
jgi:hypothetical protein